MKETGNDKSIKDKKKKGRRYTVIKPVTGIVMLLAGISGIWWGLWAGSLQRGLGLLTRTVAYPELLRFYPYVIGISVILVLCGGVLFVRNLTLPRKKSITCKNCGRTLPKGAIFCTVCGEKAGETEEDLDGHVISGEEKGLGEKGDLSEPVTSGEEKGLSEEEIPGEEGGSSEGETHEEETGSGTGETGGEGRESKEEGTSGNDGTSKDGDKVANDN